MIQTFLFLFFRMRPGVYEEPRPGFAPFVTKQPLQGPIRPPQPAHRQDLRPSLASFSLSAMSSAGIQPFPTLPIAPIPTSAGAVGSSLASAFMPYPSTPFSAMALSAAAHSSDLRSLQLYQSGSRPQTQSDINKLKTPIINRNYLELAMLVCNTFRGKLFPCPHCRYVTDRRNNLKRHISTMHQACEKLLECCGVSFSTKASLREHIMIFHHNGYSCPYCGRRFCRKALLKRHLSVHSGQKDYTCPTCDYATSHKSNLERHKRIHDRLKLCDENGIFSCTDVSTHGSHSPDTTQTCGAYDTTNDNCVLVVDDDKRRDITDSDSDEELEVGCDSSLDNDNYLPLDLKKRPSITINHEDIVTNNHVDQNVKCD